MPFTFTPLALTDIILIEPVYFPDSRGFFMETYRVSDFAGAGIREHFVQDNFSRSSRGVLRGLHYQKKPDAQGKLVQCFSGKIYDVAVDIRRGSPSFGRWVARELSGENRCLLYIPAGFAHGFLVLSESADVLYKCTREYAPAADRGIFWNDPEIGITWPSDKPLVSEKDAAHPLLKDADINFEYGK
ncbi:MAG: dTDP-4-dehydrorhamnose 3,5-epimerase [Nitrospirota bacterium]